ncbi:phenylalanine--tRNA ligase subunit alpha [Natronoglycomyces albus]|uniref:Phenylalanine--tRNA ligase alpha subunit n=1 Tax=Natronoglycomyces albus TaxID=2811108 RepID=A0A895XFL9_9ACTN|nr:phenylalanine--tRNA ligase subunit alpha [Natronoglycomyces albus]QSB04124.1 phenylalanine--tRNA ligase subunit alpha [Natronoglycomyces albus]
MSDNHEQSAIPEGSALHPDALNQATKAAQEAFATAANLDQLAEAKSAHLGDKAPLSLARREIGSLPGKAKASAGKNVNIARTAVSEAFEERKEVLTAQEAARILREETVDVTARLGGKRAGARHPINAKIDAIADYFLSLGFEVADGPEVDLEWFAFDALNIHPDHPARTMMDTFHIADSNGNAGSGLVMRPHTSTVQIHTMLERKNPPIYTVAPGRVYRTDEVDSTHSPVFHQTEGLVVDEGITIANLRGTLSHWARAMFGEDAEVRFRPSYFPFTEPSMEVDLWFTAHKDGPRWIEWGGCGMVNPRVLAACGIDPEKYSGFAFGMGVDRALMLSHDITDLRDIIDGDIRFPLGLRVEE